MGSVANIKVEPMNVTWGLVDLGFIDGDVELSFEEQMVDITAHQEGTNVISAIRTGKAVEISITLKETHLANLKELFGAGGSLFTPVAGTEVFGWGNEKDFTQVLTQAAKLLFHPVTAVDETRDWGFWLAYPMPESVSFSGENPMTVSVSFKIFPDLAKTDVRLFVGGDTTQAGL